MDYYNLPTYTLKNGYLQLDILANAGPRIVRLRRAGSDENLLAETPDIHWDTPYGPFYIQGGHRLWHAPEAFPRTYHPDNDGLKLEPLPEGLRLIGRTETASGIRKEIEIHLEAGEPKLKLVHRLVNESAWPVRLAAWAITQLPLGGTMHLPQPNQPADNEYLPNRRLALWTYTRLQDPRLELADDFIRLHAHPDPQALKIGCYNTHGWAAYVRSGVAFIKRFNLTPNAEYPDYGCNVEVYCKDRFCELETLGPLTTLNPGQAVTHIEEWEIRDAAALFPG
jgi:hypothetical protein